MFSDPPCCAERYGPAPLVSEVVDKMGSVDLWWSLHKGERSDLSIFWYNNNNENHQQYYWLQENPLPNKKSQPLFRRSKIHSFIWNCKSGLLIFRLNEQLWVRKQSVLYLVQSSIHLLYLSLTWLWKVLSS